MQFVLAPGMKKPEVHPSPLPPLSQLLKHELLVICPLRGLDLGYMSKLNKKDLIDALRFNEELDWD